MGNTQNKSQLQREYELGLNELKNMPFFSLLQGLLIHNSSFTDVLWKEE